MEILFIVFCIAFAIKVFMRVVFGPEMNGRAVIRNSIVDDIASIVVCLSGISIVIASFFN